MLYVTCQCKYWRCNEWDCIDWYVYTLQSLLETNTMYHHMFIGTGVLVTFEHLQTYPNTRKNERLLYYELFSHNKSDHREIFLDI